MASPKILIVEDEPIIAADLTDRLLELNYSILASVSSGEEALSMIGQSLPDLILMDVNLAGKLDGIATALQIRRDYGGIPLVFLTSNSDEVTYRRARQAAPKAFLSKPFRGRDLVHAIDLALTVATAPAKTKSVPTAETPDMPDGESAIILSDRLFLKVKERLVRIMVSDILWVQADDYYCRLFTGQRDYLVTKTLKRFCALLPVDGPFLRCHRSYLVNMDKVTEIGELSVYIGKQELPISRAKRAELLARINNP